MTPTPNPRYERYMGPCWLSEKQTVSAVTHWKAKLKEANARWVGGGEAAPRNSACSPYAPGPQLPTLTPALSNC